MNSSGCSAVWQIYLYRKIGIGQVRCLKCEKVLKMAAGSTKALIVHTNSHPEYAEKLKKLMQLRQMKS